MSLFLLEKKFLNIHILPTLSALSDHVTLCQIDGIKIIRIDHPKGKAAISLFGGHVISYQPVNEKEIIWLSENVDLSGKKPIRGGIPICWPWFGKAAEPSHGFVRTREWSLNQHRENENGVIVSLRIQHSDETLAIWPYEFSLELQVELADSLKVSLITTNKSTKSFKFGGALHTYFDIGDIHQTQVTKLGEHYIEAKKSHVSNQTAIFSGEVDRIYTLAQKSNDILDTANQRTISLTHSGNNSVVVWNPWQEIATSMVDMANDGYLGMVCVESAIYDNQLELKPEQQHTLACEIRV